MDLRSVVFTSMAASFRRRRLLLTLCTGAIVVAALVVSLATLAFAVPPSFPDVPSTHPYHAAISGLASQGIIGGYTNGDFGPNDPVKRQQFAKMAVLTGGYPVSESDVCAFVDVDKGDASTPFPDNYIAVCAAKGITTGKTATTFDPYSFITRLQVISMVVRMADNLQPGLLAAVPEGLMGRVGWADDPTHGANAARAEHNGLLAGLDLSLLSPTGNMTRGEVAQVLHNLLGKLTLATTTTAPSTTTTTALADYENLGGILTSAPAACSWGEGRLDVFARGIAGNLWHKWYGPGGWSAWTDLGGFVKAGTDPAAVAWSDSAGGHFDVFVIGLNDHIWQKGWTGSAWSDWRELTFITGIPASSPAAAFSPQWFWLDMTRLLFAAPDGSVRQVSYEAGSAIPPTGLTQDSLGGTAKTGSAPAAVGVGNSGVLEVFIRGSDDALWHRQPSGYGDASAWTSLGGVLTSSPAACACDGRLEVFARGPDNGLWQKTYTTSWSDWKSLASGAVASSPSATSWGPNRIDVFVCGADLALWHKWWDGTAWRP